jgi:hypothetical protein
VNAIIFVAALSQYNEVCYEQHSSNKLRECFDFLEELGKKEILKSVPFYLYLNKQDIFLQELKKDKLINSLPNAPKTLKEIEIPKKIKEKYPSWESKSVASPSYVDIYVVGTKYKIQDLSEDVLCHIFSFLKYFEVGNLSTLNSFFHDVTNSDVIWRYLCQLHDPYVFLSDVELSSKDSDPFPLWKSYFMKNRNFYFGNEFLKVEMFVETFGRNFKTVYATNAIDDSIRDVLKETLDDILRTAVK